jgi:hypothetical protein
MTYLTQLAARTLNQLPVVQPRLPSRFESVQREALTDAPAPLEYATFTPGTPSITAGAAPFTPTPIAPEPLHVSTMDLPSTHEIAPTPGPTLDTAPANATPVYQEATRRVADNDRVAPGPPATVVEHDPMTHGIERDAGMIISSNTITEHTTTIERHTLIERERIAAPTLVAPAEAHAHVPRIAPSVTPYVSPAPERIATPEPTPVIHVSIGRIEVRAIHTPAPTPGAPPASKHTLLSLDEYLRGARR